MKLINLFSILFLSSQILSQDIKFLDTEYGNLGEIQIDQENIFQNIVEYCSTNNSIYISGNFYQDTIGGLTSSDIFIIDSEGNSNISNIGSTDLQNVKTTSEITTWLENNHFWKIIKEDELYDTLGKLIVKKEITPIYPGEHIHYLKN